MGLRATIVRRWTRRDVFAVLVIGLTVAFVTGTAVIVGAATAQTTDVAREFDRTGSVTYVPANAATRFPVESPAHAVRLPLAQVSDGAGNAGVVVAIPNGTDGPVEAAGLAVPVPPDRGVTRGMARAPHGATLTGTTGTATVQVQPSATTGAIPPGWYVARPALVERLGRTGTLVVTPANGDDTRLPAGASPIRGALAFFATGARSIVKLLAVGGLAVGVLVAITVFSVSRMAVADRRRTIGIFRATGGTGWAVVATFAARAALLTGVGIVLGYALGVIVPNAIVNAGVFLGVRTSLSPRVSLAVARLLAPVYVLTLVLGTLAGGLAAASIARSPPRHVVRHVETRSRRPSRDGRSWLPRRVAGRVSPPDLALLEWRAVVPTAATLAVFVAIVVLGWSAGVTVGPAVGADGTTITEPGAVHPIASTVPAGYAPALAGAGVNASGELLAFTVFDDRPVLVRGADFEAFATVSDARIVGGRRPSAPSEALVGEALANRHGIAPGDSLALGGSTRATLTRVRIVGVYAAPGPFDDQVLVSLPTARHLTGKGPDAVQFVRTDRQLESPGESGGLTVLELSLPNRTTVDRPVRVSATVLNAGRSTVGQRVTASMGEWAATRTTSVPPLGRRTLTFTVTPSTPGTYSFRLLDAERDVRVAPPGPGTEDGPTDGTGTEDLRIDGLPDRVPPDSTRRVRVTSAGRPVSNATVVVGERRFRTSAAGVAAVTFGDPGRVSVRVTAQNATTSRPVAVTPDASRRLDLAIGIEPSHPSSLTRPTVTVRARNPWGQSLNRTVELTVAGRTLQRRVAVPAGGRATVRERLPRLAPGEYRVRIAMRERAGGRRVQSVAEPLRVAGNDRLVAALAARGHAGGATSIETAIESVFGDLTLVTAGIVALAGLMSVGSIAATFAGAVSVRRRTLGILRATGAGPRRVFRMVLWDVARIALPAIGLAMVGGYGLVAIARGVGLLTVFGIGIEPVVSARLLGTIVLGAGAVVLVGASLATVAVLRADPARLVRGDRSRPPESFGGGDRA
jgi:ABC-type antimicrobial peptide transport system permease subunit